MQMPRSTSNTSRPAKWAVALRREVQIAIGRQLGVEQELPQDVPPELKTVLADKDKEHDPYANIVGTC
jgi:hypothetical protein